MAKVCRNCLATSTELSGTNQPGSAAHAFIEKFDHLAPISRRRQCIA